MPLLLRRWEVIPATSVPDHGIRWRSNS